MEKRRIKVFIVHGQEDELVSQLKDMITSLSLKPVLVNSLEGNGLEQLEDLKELTHTCKGGFVLLSTGPQILFQAGMLTALSNPAAGICFFVQETNSTPFQTHGLLYEEIGDEINFWRLKQILASWGFLS
ncbi:MAG: nucleotide-binding protein [Bacteroidales bacterium]|nr:nucleotide-binding protein [Bacteroidales bacterium]